MPNSQEARPEHEVNLFEQQKAGWVIIRKFGQIPEWVNKLTEENKIRLMYNRENSLHYKLTSLGWGVIKAMKQFGHNETARPGVTVE